MQSWELAGFVQVPGSHVLAGCESCKFAVGNADWKRQISNLTSPAIDVVHAPSSRAVLCEVLQIGETPFILAVRSGNVAIVRLLATKAGVPLNFRRVACKNAQCRLNWCPCFHSAEEAEIANLDRNKFKDCS